MTFTDASNITEFVDRYTEVWNESDPDTRRQMVRRLWAADAVEYTSGNEYRGHEALDERVAHAHTEFVANGGYRFRPVDEPAAHHGAVLITVEMVPAEGGPRAWIGTILAFLGDDGRIEREYQFGRNVSPA